MHTHMLYSFLRVYTQKKIPMHIQMHTHELYSFFREHPARFVSFLFVSFALKRREIENEWKIRRKMRGKAKSERERRKYKGQCVGA